MADITSIFKGGFYPLEKIITENTDLADPLSSFVEVVRENGIEINDRFTPDGTIQRFPASDSKRGEKDGWAVLHLDGPIPVGVYGSFKGGGWEKKWTANIGRQMTMIEKLQVDQWLSENKKRREEAKKMAQEEAAKRAEDEVGSLADAADDHPYLIKKHIKAYGIKIDRSGRLVIPMISADGEIQSYQRIDQEGNKRFLMGGKVDGGFFEIRGNRNVVYICEGYATGASIHEATGASVFVAFYADNLIKVSKAVRGLFPAAKMYIAADNDQFTDGNPGMAKAKVAAHEAKAEVVYPVFSDDLLADKPTDFNDLHVRCGIDVVRKFLGIVGAKQKKSKFEFTRCDHLEIIDTDYVVDNHIESDSLNLFFGESGCGKSFVTVGIACCVATGTPWHGHEVKKGPVFYIAGEGHNGLSKRIRAWFIANKVEQVGAMLFKSHRSAQMYDLSAAIDVAEAVNELCDEAGATPSMIIIDTVARNMGGDENSTQDMNQFIENIDSLLRIPHKAAVVLVHHTGKASPGKARGSTALRGALDAEYFVEQDQASGVINLKNTKMKDGDVPPDKSFSIRQIGLEKMGKKGEMKGAYLETVDISGLVKQATEKRDALTKNQRKAMVALECLIFARNRDGISVPITVDDWRDSANDQGLDRSRFRESKNALEAKKVVRINQSGVVEICVDDK